MIDKGDRSAVGYYERLSEALDNEGKAIPQKFTPKEAEYMPKVGEWCEVKEAGGEKWIKAKIYGLADLPNEYVCKPKGYWYDDYKLEQIRPIKSDREVFIERSLACDCEPQQGMLSRIDFVGVMYDNGARFTGE